jgi:hypothetical protein
MQRAGVAVVAASRYFDAMAVMRAITIKLSETTLRRLRQEARRTGKSIPALIRARVEIPFEGDGRSVFDVASDLAGSVAGSRSAARNTRRFGRP